MNHSERIKERKRAIVEFLRRYSVAVCDADENGIPLFGATGFFVRLPGGVVLVTAEHVISSITRGPRAVLHGVTIDLPCPPQFATSTLGVPRRVADVASIPVLPDDVGRIPPESLVPLSALEASSRSIDRGPYFILGFHQPNQDIDVAKEKVELMQTHITLSEAKRAFYVHMRWSPNEQLLLGGKPSSIVTPTGRGGVPHFDGMSGSPVWRITSGALPSPKDHPPLVGLFVSQPNNSRKVLRADRVSGVLQHLRIAHPELFPQESPEDLSAAS